MSKWKVNELLAILDMPEDNQKMCLALDGILKTAGDEKGAAYLTESLAETAFRMRDEVCGEVVHMFDRLNYEMALRQVYTRVGIKSEGSEFLIWLSCEAKPIHWIIAALIAEVRKEEEKQI